MPTMIFVNLPVKDLNKSKAFYEAVGFTNNPQFTDETAACMVLSEHIYVMLLTHAKFLQFTDKSIIDARKQIQTLLALSEESRAAVDARFQQWLKAGGREASPMQDHGFMIQRSLEDPDGHVWEIFHMDMSAVPPAPQG
ncbi:MAG: VOC family protein [Beijerinckiaceae bacterium]